jgi:hypothetical protein
MNEPVNDPQADLQQEELLDRALHELPLRRAPARLESRVLQELRRRAALPWWRRSFARWPRTVQAAFGVMCAALIVLTGLAAARLAADLGSLQLSGALSMSWVQQLSMLVGVAAELTASLAHFVPADWIYAGLAASTALYAALFGLAVAAYRTLYINSESAGDLGS